MSSIEELRVAAKLAVRDARVAESVACWDDSSFARGVSENAYNAALKAIDALAAAVEVPA